MEIKINKEIKDFNETMFFGLSVRQFIFAILACAAAVGIYFGCRPFFNTEVLSWLCMIRCNELPHDSIVLAEQMRTLDKSRFIEYIGKASNNTMRRVDHAIDVIAKTKTKHNYYKRYKPNERR